MRDIKFRFVYQGEHQIHYKWYYLDQLIDMSLRELSDVHDQMVLISKDEYTGLKDKNGKEIYEGDVVEHIRGLSFGDDYHTGEPVDDDKTIKRKGKIAITTSQGIVINGVMDIEYDSYDREDEHCKYWGNPGCYSEYCEIIGNIHENLEMLK